MSFTNGNQTTSWRNSNLPNQEKNELDESDEDLFTVPDMEARPTDSITTEVQQSCSGANGKRRRGRNPADKEYRKHKRLLRNRVSAQQARERKKVYVNDLESKANELLDKNSNLEEKISTLVNENNMLRKVLMSIKSKVDENIDTKHDQSAKS
ncbi:hypothetical protein GIB67_029338 [Kingdonia uniflora]|uniref:BZIP domain-containing protein n=1 Tax=Kingdonia uniflora TaxID=39325 RepID=A0A7J7N8C8_9MAGN|nr:hypothetical protein GIB67_029338 [Kingdonia uniflora]